MSKKTCGSAVLLAVIVSICALAVFGPSESAKSRKWCGAGVVEHLFLDCEKVAGR